MRIQQDILGSIEPSYSHIKWIGVIPRFTNFLANLDPTSTEVADVVTKRKGIARRLNAAYWGSSSETENHVLVGSWGKQDCIRPPTDADILFQLPVSVYERYERRTGNKQSALLQEVKDQLLVSYPQTEMRGDGQVLIIRFNSISIEIAPVFKLRQGGFLICDTNNGGRYKTTDPVAEAARIHESSRRFNNNTIHLIKMVKCWKLCCHVPLASFHIELLAVDFIEQWLNRGRDHFWYDWMIRDFFLWLLRQKNRGYFVPGSNEQVNIGDEWVSRAETAANRSLKACDFEYKNQITLAGQEWQKLFGIFIPVSI